MYEMKYNIIDITIVSVHFHIDTLNLIIYEFLVKQ